MEDHPQKIWRQGQKPRVTLAALARRVGVTPSHLSEIENYKNEPSLDLAGRLSEATGLEMKAFVLPSRTRHSEAAV